MTREELEQHLRHRSVRPGEAELFVVEAGPEDGPLVILLHGFPEFWYGWREQILPLAEAGYRVLVPDQRGYHISDKPRKRRDYKLDVLARDVVGLIDDADREEAMLVGHDWGGLVAWHTAMVRPDRVARMVILNAPHPAAFRAALRSSREQRKRSQYIFWFQFPGLAERRMAKNGYELLKRALQGTSRQGTFSDSDLENYVEAWSAPGALTGMLNWYRAIPLNLRNAPRPNIEAPTRILWGAEDRFLGAELAEASRAFCQQGEVEVIDGATHWVQHEEPNRVNRRILDFFARETRDLGPRRGDDEGVVLPDPEETP
jgi:pimeloyl-ACP methyl ester carboxylesterase